MLKSDQQILNKSFSLGSPWYSTNFQFYWSTENLRPHLAKYSTKKSTLKMNLPMYRLEYKEVASFLGKAIENYCIIFFSFAIWLPYNRLWVIIEATASLTYVNHRVFLSFLEPSQVPWGVWTRNLLFVHNSLNH